MKGCSLVEDAHPDGCEHDQDTTLDDSLVGDHHTACTPHAKALTRHATDWFLSSRLT